MRSELPAESHIKFGRTGPCGRRWRTLEVLLIILVILLLIALIVVVVLFVLELNSSDATREVKRTEVYVQEAGRMLQWMNVSEDPCEDFYLYSCGNYIATQKIPEGQLFWNFLSIFTEVLNQRLKDVIDVEIEANDMDSVKKVKLAYQACMDEEMQNALGGQPMLDVLDTLGTWPPLNPNWDENSVDIATLMAQVMLMGRQTYASLTLKANSSDNTHNSIFMDSPGIPMANHLTSDDIEAQALVNSYRQIVLEMALLLVNNNPPDRNHLETEINAMIDFEAELANITLQNTDVSYILSLAELKVEYPQIWSWDDYLNTYIAPSGQTLSDSEVMTMFNMEYYGLLNNLLDNTNKRTIVTYLLWKVVDSWYPLLSKEFRDLSDQKLSLISPLASAPPQWQYCVSVANGYLAAVTGRLYVDHYFLDAAKVDVENIGEDLKQTLFSILEDASWMDATTMASAIEKLENMPIRVGYPPWIMDDEALNQEYEGVDITNATQFMNLVHITKDQVNNVVKNYFVPVDRNAWSMTATTMNAAYIYNRNAVEICAAILQRHAFSQEYPRFMNYGGIGVFVGHELTHGFDSLGRNFDLYGNIQPWWTDETTQVFMERAACLVNQYNGFTFPGTTITVNGVLTLPENIADNGGLKEGYLAYESWLERNGGEEATLPGFEHMSNEQMFFLSWSQLWCEVSLEVYLENQVVTNSHAPNRYRVIGTLQNSPDFARVYNCPTGSYMNPETKCGVW